MPARLRTVRAMSDFTDPRRAGGDVAGPGGPHDKDGVIVDTRRAVLLDHTHASALLEHDPMLIAVMLDGRINRVEERAKILYLMDLDGAASLVAEVVSLAGRLPDPAKRADFIVALETAMGTMPQGPAHE